MTDPSPTRPLRVFLCHATNDKPAVRDLHRRLSADGFAPWLDEEDLLPGQKWQVEIPKAVRKSDVVLVCLSQHSINKTGYVQREIRFALDVARDQPDGTIFLIPLRLEECTVPDSLIELQWVNFYEEGGYARLVRALKKRAADLPVATPAPTTPATSPASNVSGGVNVKADQVNMRDVVGRDQIHQTTINAQNVTIIQSGAAIPEVKPAAPVVVANHRVIGGLDFVRVPAGKFIMGSNDGRENEKPQHTVEIAYDYWIGKYPVTNEQFAKFVAAAKYKFDQRDWKQKATHPVVGVSWRDALAYCQWLNTLARDDLQGLAVRLPTEAEWEKAARGVDGRTYPWGNDFDKNKCNSDEGKKSSTTPVGAYSPQGDSPYGAADMAGNVWEWCHSLHKPYPYQATDGRESESGGATRVIRGGSWNNELRNARCAFRDRVDPDLFYYFIGFRVVVSLA